MRRTTARAQRIVAGLTTKDKISLLSGQDFWMSKAAPGVDPTMLTDGPHGLRKQTNGTDHIGLAGSVPATCFPTAVTLGSTWDTALVTRVGEALGRECRAQEVGVLLGPGLNIKRHPAGGRNFEYFSEDPVVSGHMAAAMVNGIQSQGVGACLKHYAVNNQEENRMRLDVLVDERTMREIYLRGFQIAVRESQPWTVMSSYNLVNGTHVGESRKLLTEILRDEMGFDGLVVSDWGAVYDRAQGIAAGMDLEMPGSMGAWDPDVEAALASGALHEEDLDTAATRVVDLLLRAAEGRKTAVGAWDARSHHALARQAAAAGMVLLTNDSLLPLPVREGGTLALIGAFAEAPRYQGSGSSQVNPTIMDTALASLREALGKRLTYAPGYDPVTGETTPALLEQARQTAADADFVIVLAGLPGRYESEGYDRTDLQLPHGHLDLIRAATSANAKTGVIILGGAPVDLSWHKDVAAVAVAYLGGQAGGAAIADVLLGDAEPGGRLAESFPAQVTDLPAAANWPGTPTQVQYREGQYVGYRFHDTADVPAQFPFGHGLSFTQFQHADAAVRVDGEMLRATVTVTNTGLRAGSDVVQLYLRKPQSLFERPFQELKAFAKVWLAPGESTNVSLAVPLTDLAVWDSAASGWHIEPGTYEARFGKSSTDVWAALPVVLGEDISTATKPGHAAQPASAGRSLIATEQEFAELLGQPIPVPIGLLPFTLDSTVKDLQQTALGRMVSRTVLKQAQRAFPAEGEDLAFFEAVFKEMPIRGLAMMSSGAISLAQVRALVKILNALSVNAWGAKRASAKRR